MLNALNIFFFIFHISLIIFNLFGWMFRRTRKWNLVTLFLTVFSWFVLGIFYGWGYCFLTDWHWEVREKLGYETEHSYIHFLVKKSGIHLSEETTNNASIALVILALAMSIYLNVRDYRRNKI